MACKDDEDVFLREAGAKGDSKGLEGSSRDAYGVGSAKGLDSKASSDEEIIRSGGGVKAEAKDQIEAEEEEGESLVHKIAKFFFENDDFANSFEAWVEDHAHLIDLDTEECKLE